MWGAVLHDVWRASPDANLCSRAALSVPWLHLTVWSSSITRSAGGSFPAFRYDLLALLREKLSISHWMSLTGSPFLVNYPVDYLVIYTDSRD